MTEMLEVPVHTDDRGALLAVDFDRVPFDVRRVFVVTDVPAGVPRGGHRADCRELVVLIRGRADVVVNGASHVLERAGDALAIEPDDQVSYTLGGVDHAILVLADRPWRPRDPS